MLGTILKVDERRTATNDQRTRKLITMHKALHPRDDGDRLYVYVGKRSIKDSGDAAI